LLDRLPPLLARHIEPLVAGWLNDEPAGLPLPASRLALNSLAPKKRAQRGAAARLGARSGHGRRLSLTPGPPPFDRLPSSIISIPPSSNALWIASSVCAPLLDGWVELGGTNHIHLVPGSEVASRPFADIRPACEIEPLQHRGFPEWRICDIFRGALGADHGGEDDQCRREQKHKM
jgi:hypothetical protein